MSFIILDRLIFVLFFLLLKQMPFSNLETEAGVAALDSFLVDKSYIER